MNPPDILLLMFDQLSAQSLPAYGHPVVRSPALDVLATRSTVFENAYCNSPLCAPSRASLLTSQYCSRIGAYDNAAELASSIPTFAHHLRALGYRTALAGKMHFAGPDQLHGFEERLTTDVYPSDFCWAPDWTRPDERPFWYHDMLSVVEAGPYRRTLQLDFDEDVAHRALRWIHDRAREPRAERRPFCLVVSFTQPHDPYMAPPEYWDRYRDEDIDLPAVAALPRAARDPHSERLRAVWDADRYQVEEHHVRAARRAYYAMISWLDERCARLLDAVHGLGLGDSTAVVATADHGDMLGERGLWYKMCFFERAVRVPLLIGGPGWPAGRRVAEPVSLLDLLPTLVEIAGGSTTAGDLPEAAGSSLLAGLRGQPSSRPVISEFLGEGAVAPMLMVRDGRHKYITCDADPPQLYDLEADPHELHNLAGSEPAVAERLHAHATAHWDSNAVHSGVLASQARRRLVHRSLMQGKIRPWDFQPCDDAAAMYNRNYDGELYATDRRARVPHRPAPAPDGPATKGGQ